MVKRVRSQDVADLAGVSRTTVSFVLNDDRRFTIPPETRKKVLDAADQLGYVPNASAQALASRKAKAIGLIMTRTPQYIASDAFLPQVIAGLMDVIKQHKLSLLIDYVDPGRQIEIYRGLVGAKHIDGMILLTPRNDDEGLKHLSELDVPVVVMGELPNDENYSVDVDNRVAARQAVDFLISQGHQRIACILNAPQPYSSANQRLLGYMDALQAAGIPQDDTIVQYADFDPKSGYQQMNRLLENNSSLTAVFVASDLVAVGAIAAIREAGLRIPEDLSVIGFDNLPLSEFLDPPLTTIKMPAQKLAQQACYLLMELMKGHSPEDKHPKFDTELVVRKSTGMI